MASWGFVVVLMRGKEVVRVIGCASGRAELDKSHPEHMCGTRLTNKQCGWASGDVLYGALAG